MTTVALLDGRVALVTGAGQGIGAAVAEDLGRLGARVLVNDLGTTGAGDGQDASLAEATANRIRAAGGDARSCAADVGNHDEVSEMIDLAIAEWGRLDVVVNVAGILRDRMIFNLSEADWDAVIRVHLKGHFNVIKHASRHWREHRDDGAARRVINFTSVSGLHGSPGQPNYAAAKMGIVGLTYSCANALTKYGVTSNAISPGANTRMTMSLSDDQRISTPEEQLELSPDRVAPVVSYIASAESGWLNGRVIDVRRNRVALYNIPEQIRVIESTERWTAETVGAKMRSAFRRPAEAPLEFPF